MRWLAAAALLGAMATAGGGCGHQRQGRWVRRVKLHGADAVGGGEIKRRLATRASSFWPWGKKVWFEPALLDLDVKRVEALYAARGFFRARVTERKVVPRKGGKAVDVELTIDEGQPTRVTAVELRGIAALPAELRRRLRGELPLRRGERFDYQRYRRSKKRVAAALARAGHAYAKVTGEVRVDRDKRTAAVEIRARPGPPVRLGKALVAGHGSLPAAKLAQLAAWRAGDRYHPDLLSRTRARLFSQRVVSSVRLRLPREPTRWAAVRIEVQPGKLRELRLGAGIGVERRRHEVRLSGRWTWRNFLGGLRTLELRLQPAFVTIPAVWDSERSGPAVESDVKLTQPDLLNTRISVFGLVGYDLGVHEGYRYHGPRASVGAERMFLRHLRVGLSWSLQFLDFFDIEEEAFDPTKTPLGLGFQSSYRLAWLEPFVQLDLRDSLLDPRAGFFAEARLEGGLKQLGGEFRYLKLVPEARGYIPLGTKRLVLALRARFGAIFAHGDSPVTRRLALGGPNSHRGFTFGRLAPQALAADGERRVPLGGNAALLLSGDLRLRVWRIFGSWLGLTAFCDAGDTTVDLERLELDQLHLAVGGSLDYLTPIGALRVGVGVRLNRLDEVGPDGRANPDPGERIAFHLTIGAAF